MPKWPVVVVLLAPMAGAQVSGSTIPTAGSWSLVTFRNSQDVTVMVSALNAIDGSANRELPTLGVRCEEGKLAVYVGTGRRTQQGPDDSLESRAVRLFFDERPVYSETWSVSGLGAALLSRDPILDVDRLLSSRRLRFEFTLSNGRPAAVEFPVTGLLRASAPLRAACPSAWSEVTRGLQSLSRSGFAPNSDSGRVYFEFQVDKPAAQLPDGPAPVYPQTLRAANVEGEVLAQFVVDTLGQAEIGTFKVLKTTHELFTQAIRDVLPSLRFSPAELQGRKVRQLVQMPFVFRVTP